MTELEYEYAFKGILNYLRHTGYDIDYNIFYGTLTITFKGAWVFKCRTWNDAHTYISGLRRGTAIKK